MSTGHTTDLDTSIATTRTRVVGELRELIAALDRRVPQVERMGEVDIAKAAEALRKEALARIEALEREPDATLVRAGDSVRGIRSSGA